MRIAAAILLSAKCFFVAVNCHAQDPCSASIALKPGEKPLKASERIHRILLRILPGNRNTLYFGEVELVLKCGTLEDAAEVFAAVKDAAIRMVGATVAEANQDLSASSGMTVSNETSEVLDSTSIGRLMRSLIPATKS
jgi:hypothetical protein